MFDVKCFSCRENQNTNFIFNGFFFNFAVYGIMCKIVEPERSQITIRGMRFTFVLFKATNTH